MIYNMINKILMFLWHHSLFLHNSSHTHKIYNNPNLYQINNNNKGN